MENSVSYSFRKSVLERCKTFTLSADGILITQEGRAQTQIAYGEIRRVRLVYEPFRYRTENYACELTLDDSVCVIYSTSFESFAVFKDLRETYTPFIRELVCRLGTQAQSVEIYCGHSPSGFYARIALMLLALLVLLIVFTVIPLQGGFGVSVKLFLVVCYLYYAVTSCRANYPQPIRDGMVPERVLPGITTS